KKFRLKHSIGSSLEYDRYLIIVEKGSMIPISTTSIVKTVTDNQVTSSATIHHGENPQASNNPTLTKIRLSGLPPLPAGQAQMKYHFTIDIKGNLKMEKYSLDNGKGVILNKKILDILEEI